METQTNILTGELSKIEAKEISNRKGYLKPLRAIKEDDRILDEIRIKTDSCMSGTGWTQPFLEAEDKSKSQDRSVLL